MPGFILNGFAQTIIVTNPTNPWTVPIGVTSIKVEVWGGGGGGGGCNSTTGATYGSGGGGGAYNVSTFQVSSGQTYTISRGAGGTGSSDANGKNGTVSSVSGPGGSVSANPGSGGARRGGLAGTSGTGGFNNGGNGGRATSNGAGGGGGAGNATPAGTGKGGDGSNTAAGSSGAGALPGGAGGAYRNSNGNGNAGAAPGGGGGGGYQISRNGNKAGGAGASGQVVITYTPVLGTTITGFAPTSACSGSGQSVSITGTNFTGATALTFYNGQSALFTVNNATQITATLPAGATTGPISVATPLGTGTSSGSFTVNALPTTPTSVSATPAIVCSGASSNLKATSTNNTIRWYTTTSGGSPIGTSTSGANFSVTPTSTTTYYAEALNGTGCSSATRTLVMVTVNPIPTITSTNPGSVCGSGTVTLAATSSAGIINWYSGATGGLILGTGISFTTPIITLNTTYYVDATANGCKTGTRTAIMATVNVIPAAPRVGTITQPTCASSTGSVVLNGLPATGTWSLTRTPGGTTTPGTGTSTTISGIGAGTYTYTVTNASGCTSSASDNFVINTQPATPIVPNQTASISSGATFTVTPGGGAIPVGTTYTWTAPIYTGSVTGGSAQTVPQINISGTLTIPSGSGSATYTVTPTSGNCVGATFTVTVTVTFSCVPVTLGTQPIDNIMCATSGNASFAVVASGAAPFTYQWQYYNGSIWAAVINDTPSGASYTNPSTATLSVTGIATAGSFQFRCYITNCNGGNNATSAAANLIVNALPVPILTSSDADNIFCSGTSISFIAGDGTGYNFRVGGVSIQNGVLTTFTTNSLTNGQAVDVIITNANGCSATSAPILNIVNPLPFLIVSTPATCSTDLATYSLAVTVSSGILTSTSGTVTNTGSNVWTITGVLSGTNITITVTDSGGCQNSLSVTAPNCSCPVILPPVSGGDKSYCASGLIPAINATVLTGETVDWYNASLGGTPLKSGSLSYTPATAGTYYAVARNTTTNCESTTRTPITITMNPLPISTLASSDADNIFCAGTTVTFTAGGGTGFNFRVGGVSVQNGALTTYTTNSLTNGQIVDVMVTSAIGCTATSAGITNTVNALPIPTLTSSDADNIFCAGTTITFTAGGGTGFNFRVGGVSVQNGASTTYTTDSLTNGQIVDVIVNSAIGCIATSAGITNTVNTLPIPTLTSTDADNIFCSGTTVTFTAGGGTGFDFRVEGLSVQNGASTTYTTSSLTNGQVVDVIVTNANGCIATSPAITNSVDTIPTADAGTGGNNCGLGFHLNASLNAGTGTWSKVSGPGNATFSPDVNTANSVVTVSAYGSYTFRWTVVNGTCSTNASVTVIFIQQPSANAGSGGEVCVNNFSLNGLLSTGTGTWTMVTGSGSAVFTPDNHQANAKVTVNQFGSYNFAWTVVNSTCTSSDVVNVVFHDVPLIKAARDTAICKDSSIQLLAQGTGSFSWIPAALVNNPNISNPVSTPDTTTTFTVNLTDQFGCKNSDSTVVEVKEKPVANAGPDQMLAYQFETSLSAMLSFSDETGIWQAIAGTGKFIDSTFTKTSVKGLSLGENKFLWTINNGVCPSSYDTVMITVNDFIIPTLITPNMDGINDYFVLRGLATLGKTELRIFDRRGVEVYKNMNYDNFWNGVDYNKNPLPDDTYFFILKSAKGKSISGYIVIRR